MDRQRVLIIEDNPANMELATDLLEMAGYQVLSADNAEDGISLAREQSPVLIVMDVGLPDMDGLTATRMLKEDPRTRDIPVLAATSHAMKGDEENILAAGCDAYVAKPMDTREFPKTVARLIEESGRKGQ